MVQTFLTNEDMEKMDKWISEGEDGDEIPEGCKLFFADDSKQSGDSDDLTLLTGNEREKLIQEVIEALGTPVFGSIDGNKVITLSGALAPGTYTLKYEGTDGVIGTIVVEG